MGSVADLTSVEDVERHVVEELVRDDHAGRSVVGQIREASHGRVLGLLASQPGGPLDEHIVERVRARRRGGQHRARERATPGPGLDDTERRRLAEITPPRVDRVREDRAEQRADLGTREEVAPAAGGSVLRVEAVVLVVQRGVDERGVGDRTVRPYVRREPIGERGAGCHPPTARRDPPSVK
jgi:hypothetical protein